MKPLLHFPNWRRGFFNRNSSCLSSLLHCNRKRAISCVYVLLLTFQKSVLFLTYIWFWWYLIKIAWDKLVDSSETLCDCYIGYQAGWDSLLCKEWVLLCIKILFISKESLFYKLSFHVLKEPIFFGVRLAYSL